MKAFIQIILKSLYIYSSNTSWAILSYPSKNQTLNALNVASPSLTTEYWISSFKAYDRPIFEGSFPDWAEYSSLSAYDDRGMPIPGSSVNTAQFQSGSIDLLKYVDDSLISQPYAVIHRVYRPPGHDASLQDNEKFNVTLRGYTQDALTEEEARDNGKQLQAELQKSLGKIHADFYSDTKLYKPSTKFMPGLFPNSDAIYLICSPSRGYIGLRIDGILGDQKEWIEFIGFMATDLYTTATDDSLELSWNQPYSLFIMRGEYDPKDYGYDPKDSTQHVLYWNQGAIFPTVVLRIIDVSCSLGDCEYDLGGDAYVSPLRCRRNLGSIYPKKVTYFRKGVVGGNLVV
jgi:hypothetical protein